MIICVIILLSLVFLSSQAFKHGFAGLQVWPMRNWLENLLAIVVVFLVLLWQVTFLFSSALHPFVYPCLSVLLLLVSTPFLFFSIINIGYHLNCILSTTRPPLRVKTLRRLELLLAESPWIALDKLRKLEDLHGQNPKLRLLLAQAYEMVEDRPRAIAQLRWLFYQLEDDEGTEAAKIWSRLHRLDSALADTLRPNYKDRFPSGPLLGESIPGTGGLTSAKQ
ncbi:MAG: hypothetical protein HQL31_01820 [Planctomycetes bacterium]|nr:hypothetical protein [Planctomycetota bacterium]